MTENLEQEIVLTGSIPHFSSLRGDPRRTYYGHYSSHYTYLEITVNDSSVSIRVHRYRRLSSYCKRPLFRRHFFTHFHIDGGERIPYTVSNRGRTSSQESSVRLEHTTTKILGSVLYVDLSILVSGSWTL